MSVPRLEPFGAASIDYQHDTHTPKKRVFVQKMQILRSPLPLFPILATQPQARDIATIASKKERERETSETVNNENKPQGTPRAD